MIEILELIFSNFWTFIGTVVLINIVLTGTANIIKAFRSEKPGTENIPEDNSTEKDEVETK